MDPMLSRTAAIPGLQSPIPGPNQSPSPPLPAGKADLPAPTEDADKDTIKALKLDPLLGPPLAAMQQGDRRNAVMPTVYGSLTQAPLEVVKQSYQTARAALSDVIHQPDTQINNQLCADINELLRAAENALIKKGFDPYQPIPDPSMITDTGGAWKIKR